MQQQEEHQLANSSDSTLYDRHAATILAYARSHTASWQDAEDLTLEDGRIAVRANIYLFQNFTRRGERLGEDGCLIRYASGHAVQVHNGQREVFGERAIVAEDSQDAPPRAVQACSLGAVQLALTKAQSKNGSKILINA